MVSQVGKPFKIAEHYVVCHSVAQTISQNTKSIYVVHKYEMQQQQLHI